ncbi:hypothetical protein ASPCADRAFT_211095, partial [Aspergillus carbonarius ITEM 5010]
MACVDSRGDDTRRDRRVIRRLGGLSACYLPVPTYHAICCGLTAPSYHSGCHPIAPRGPEHLEAFSTFM